ncbi:hypothetical protein EDB85DRAFT_93608 [Lactarius pseudohatsudake]|nr:hypothetical protein EDB85DRAFT_93608 [Lactarius pseudohatsudake]
MYERRIEVGRPEDASTVVRWARVKTALAVERFELFCSNFLVHDNMPGSTNSRQLSDDTGYSTSPIGSTGGRHGWRFSQNPTFLIHLDPTNFESSETVSLTTSSSITLMTLSTTHAKDKLSLSFKWSTHPIIFAQDVGLAQNAKRTQVLDLRANDAGESAPCYLLICPLIRPTHSPPWDPRHEDPTVLSEARVSSSA